MELKHCPACGSAGVASATFCSRCGHNFAGGAAASVHSPQPVYYALRGPAAPPPKLKILWWFLGVSVALTIGAIIYFRVAGIRYEAPETQRERCNRLGVQYYKDIGSFPILSDGRNARDVVKEHCRNSLRAFDPI